MKLVLMIITVIGLVLTILPMVISGHNRTPLDSADPIIMWSVLGMLVTGIGVVGALLRQERLEKENALLQDINSELGKIIESNNKFPKELSMNFGEKIIVELFDYDDTGNESYLHFKLSFPGGREYSALVNNPRVLKEKFFMYTKLVVPNSSMKLNEIPAHRPNGRESDDPTLLRHGVLLERIVRSIAESLK